MDNINKYRHKQGLSEISEQEKKRLAFETMGEIDRMNNKLKINHKDRFGNYHIYD